MNRHRGLMLSQGSPVHPDYLCFTARAANSDVYMSETGTPYSLTLYYSRNKETWSPFIPGTTRITLSNIGDKIYFYGENQNFSKDAKNYWQFRFYSQSMEASGDITTLLTREGQDSVPNYAFYRLFNGRSSLKTAPKLSATTLGDYCYAYMFASTGLIVPPNLPAVDISEGAYCCMFTTCSNLTTLTNLPATTFKDNVYEYMFSGCSLIKVSETQTAEYCYEWRVPKEGTAAPTPYWSNWTEGMLSDTGGTYKPSSNIILNKTYYTQNEPV